MTTTKKNTPTPGEELRRRLDAAEAEIRAQAEALREEHRELHERRDEMADAAEEAASRPNVIRYRWTRLDEGPTGLDYLLAQAEAERAQAMNEGVQARLRAIEKGMPLTTSDTAAAVVPIIEGLTGGVVPVMETFVPIAKAEAITKEVHRETGALVCVVSQETATGTSTSEFAQGQAVQAAKNGIVMGKVHVRYVGRKAPYAPLTSTDVVKAAQDAGMDFGNVGNVGTDKFTLNIERAHTPTPRVALAGTQECIKWSRQLASIMAGSVGYEGQGVQMLETGAYQSSHLLTRADGGEPVGTETSSHERHTTVDARVALRTLKPIESAGGVRTRIDRALKDVIGKFVPGQGILESLDIVEHYSPDSLDDVANGPQDTHGSMYNHDSGYVVRAVFRSRPVAS